MANIDRYFIGSAILLAIVGMSLGIYMGIHQDFTLAPVHAHTNLVGWVTLTLFGLVYRSGAVRRDRWAVVHYIVAGAGAVLLPLGIYVLLTYDVMAVVQVGSLLTLSSMLIFAVNFWRSRR